MLQMPVKENIGFPDFSFTFSFCLINYNKVFTVLIAKAVSLPFFFFFSFGSVLDGYAKVSPVRFLTLSVSFGHIGVFILMFIKMLLSLPVWDCESELRMCNSLFHIQVNFFYYLNTIMDSVDLRWSLGLVIQNATNLSLLLLPSAAGIASTNMCCFFVVVVVCFFFSFRSGSLFVVVENKLLHLGSIFSWAIHCIKS